MFGVVGVDFCYLFLGLVIEGVTGALVGGGLKVVGGLVATEDVVDALEVLGVLLLLDGFFEGAFVLFYHLLYWGEMGKLIICYWYQ